MTIDQIQEQIVEEFSVFTDWMEKYTYLIELSKELQGFKEELCLRKQVFVLLGDDGSVIFALR